VGAPNHRFSQLPPPLRELPLHQHIPFSIPLQAHKMNGDATAQPDIVVAIDFGTTYTGESPTLYPDHR